MILDLLRRDFFRLLLFIHTKIVEKRDKTTIQQQDNKYTGYRDNDLLSKKIGVERSLRDKISCKCQFWM